MAKKQISVKDFQLFSEIMKTTGRIVEAAKISIGPSGLEIYGAKERIARCEITSDAVSSDELVSFSISSMQAFIKVVSTVCEIHKDDFSKLKFFIDQPFVRFESKKFKTKYSTCNEDTITQWISRKVETEMTPVFEFSSTSDMIKRLNAHSFMFSVPKDVRIYVETNPEMENNAVFATLGNRETDLNNEITFKFGLVTSGTLVEKDENGLVSAERHIILDYDRLNLFNAIQSDSISFSLMNLNALVSRVRISGKNGSFFNFNLYSTILKN